VSAPEESVLARLSRWGIATENAALVILFAALMLLAVTQIVMRIFFSSGFVWTDELLKLIVLWITLVASIAASRSDRHLRIDILSHFVPENYARWPRLIVDAFAAFICAVLAWHAFRYVQLTIEFEDTVLIDVPAWMAYSILPFAFTIMGYRFFLSAIAQLARLAQKDTS
jgi:TRAP-type C4-dicarboxylate transport system permease small subunit